jgi:hypothetical protein
MQKLSNEIVENFCLDRLIPRNSREATEARDKCLWIALSWIESMRAGPFRIFPHPDETDGTMG